MTTSSQRASSQEEVFRLAKKMSDEIHPGYWASARELRTALNSLIDVSRANGGDFHMDKLQTDDRGVLQLMSLMTQYIHPETIKRMDDILARQNAGR